LALQSIISTILKERIVVIWRHLLAVVGEA